MKSATPRYLDAGGMYYQLFTRYAENGHFTEAATGRRYNIVKIYL